MKKINKPLTILGFLTGLFFMLPKKTFGKIVKKQKYRTCDPSPWGCGHFGASRGKKRTHKGLDIVVKTGETIFSPISGEVTRFPFPYAGDINYTGIELKNETYKVKIFYVKPTVKIGTKVSKGTPIATAQNISAKYSSSMTNHAHIEVYDIKTGKLINPEKLF